MAAPALILFFTFHTFPAIKGIFYSFTNWKGYGKWEFVGLKNYINVFSDSRILRAYLFTFKLAIVTTLVVNTLSLILAMGLNARIKFRNTLRALYFVPNILGTLIVGYIFNYIFAHLFPGTGKAIGIDVLIRNILGNPDLAWIGIVVVTAWQSVAFNTIIYLSGLQTIPTDIYESCAIDGANKWKEFWKITFPLIAPFFTVNMVLAMKNFLMVFDQIMSMIGGGRVRLPNPYPF